jgi:hypothetical protein
VIGWFGQNIEFPGKDHVGGLVGSTALILRLSGGLFVIFQAQRLALMGRSRVARFADQEARCLALMVWRACAGCQLPVRGFYASTGHSPA